jgi:ATP-dependent exoDNAse (exonuclease V) beta subunit
MSSFSLPFDDDLVAAESQAAASSSDRPAAAEAGGIAAAVAAERPANAHSSPEDERDAAARTRAVDPRFNVALDASAGTGKTRVLVQRYINLLRAGVDPANILAMTFTRKAATEMRERIVDSLRIAAERGELTPARWKELQDRLGDIAISTIDAFCLSLLREFPLEADLDPGFAVADDSEVPRLVDESLDRALRICRAVAQDDERVALVFAQLGERRARTGLAALLARRIVAPDILSRFLARGRRDLTVPGAARTAAQSLVAMFAAMTEGAEEDPGEGLRTFVMSGPADPAFMLLVLQLEELDAAVRSGGEPDPRLVFAVYARASEYFLTRQGEPRTRLVHPRTAFASDGHWRRHRELVTGHARMFLSAWRAYRHDINVLVSGGVWRMFKIAETEYRRTLDAHAVLDFSDLLLRTLELMRRMEEFARRR